MFENDLGINRRILIRAPHDTSLSSEYPPLSGDDAVLDEFAARKIGWGEDVIDKGKAHDAFINARLKIMGIALDSRQNRIFLPPSTVIALNPATCGCSSLPVDPECFPVVITCSPLTFNDTPIDDDCRAECSSEKQVRNPFVFFGFMAMFVACLGLCGLASFINECRTNVIGIRKVLGARIRIIVLSLSGDFCVGWWHLSLSLSCWRFYRDLD